MAELAPNIVHRVLPFVPVRQWVLSVPWALRLRMACDPDLCRAVARAFLRAVAAWYRRGAKRQGVLDTDVEGNPLGASRAHAGTVNFVQRFGSSLALSVPQKTDLARATPGCNHVVLGVADRPTFYAASPLTNDELARVQRIILRWIERVLRARGIPDGDRSSGGIGCGDKESLLSLVQAASSGRRSRWALGLAARFHASSTPLSPYAQSRQASYRQMSSV